MNHPTATIEPLLGPGLMARLERLELVSRKMFRGRLRGERRSPRQGQSVEFADFRGYVPGDDLRFVDWNLYARLDRLFLKLFLEEEDLHFHALIDASGSMAFGAPRKLDYALRLAAALGFVALVRSDRVCVETLGQRPPGRSGPVFRGRQSVWRLVRHLETIEPVENTSLHEGIRHFCHRHSGRGIVVVISDLMDKQGYAQALGQLLARPMDVYVIQLLSEEELRPAIGGDLKLVDCEDQDATEVSVGPALLARYQQNLAAMVDAARGFCGRRGMGYVLAGNQVPVEELITGYLRKRGLVR